MNYELAKELKDAGFKQTPNIRAEFTGNKDGVTYHPTLSELIEACGNGFANLHRSNENGRWDSWEARSDKMSVEYGSTPEEAVARLYLALNKKP